MITLIPSIYLVIIIAHAWYDSYQSKKGIYIKHLRESYIYCLLCLVLFFVLGELTTTKILPLILFPLLTRAAFFDPLYNLFTGNHFLFEGVNKGKKDKSFFDELEARINLPVFVYRFIYFIAYLIYLGIYIFL